MDILLCVIADISFVLLVIVIVVIVIMFPLLRCFLVIYIFATSLVVLSYCYGCSCCVAKFARDCLNCFGFTVVFIVVIALYVLELLFV